jgi:GNAT superfamily N-acetyltransferase
LEPNQIVVRIASSRDAALIAGLGARTFRDTFAADNTEADMTAYLAGAFGVEIQARELDDAASTFLLAYIGDDPVGYARVREGAAPACVGGTRPLEIVRFYADAPWIGAGVGAALMGACLDRAPTAQCDVVWLDVWERNPRAVAFYKKWGFAVVGKQEFVLGDDIQHDLLMARPATPSH